jgi:(R,R)-butanediol dehydrogenase / meso-butanediol dehydrogenase / diacetyl reductase
MKALVYYGTRDLRYEDFPEPQMRAGEVRLRVKCSALCHTDFNEYVNGPLYVSAKPHPRTGRSVPLVLGHEFSGEVLEVAPDVTRLRPGDRVTVNAVDCCRQCELCRRGLGAQCATAALIGFGRDGGYAEYAVVPADCCHQLRPNVSFRSGALVEPLSVALHSLRRARVEAGSRAAVIGGGAIGLCTLQALRACGVLDVYVIEKSLAKRRFAEDLGATEFIHTEQFDPRQVVLEHTGGIGVDVAFECVGSGPALEIALSVTRPGGTVCLSGLIPRSIEFNWNDVLSKEKTITTTLAYNDEFPTVIAMLNVGSMKAEPLITRTLPLHEAFDTLTHFEEWGSTNIRTMIDMQS